MNIPSYRPLGVCITLLMCLLGAPAQLSAEQDNGILASFRCLTELTDAETAKAIDSVEQRYTTISAVAGGFEQYSYFVGLDQGQTSSGQVRFRRPGMMDWQYAEPEPQRYIADGKTLWYFQPEDNQVTLADFSESFRSNLPVSFLLGIGKLRESFRASSACSNRAGVVLELEPLSADAGFQRFKLLVDSKTFSPLGAQVLDVGGNETSIRLHKLVFNTPASQESFVFTIPKGVDIIDRRQLPRVKHSAISEEDIHIQ